MQNLALALALRTFVLKACNNHRDGGRVVFNMGFSPWRRTPITHFVPHGFPEALSLHFKTTELGPHLGIPLTHFVHHGPAEAPAVVVVVVVAAAAAAAVVVVVVVAVVVVVVVAAAAAAVVVVVVAPSSS